MQVAVVGGGINGAGIAWELARKAYDVTLYEKGAFGAQTSSATTKLIHGGLRYLEHLHVGLVRESLRERGWLIEHAPELVKPIEILLPIYNDSPRSRIEIRIGLVLYDLLAGRRNIARHHGLTAAEMVERAPLERRGLRGGFSYWDAQVDDGELARTVVESARREGATAREFTEVVGIEEEDGGWRVRTSAGDVQHFDLVINAAGPWMNKLLDTNDIHARYRLSLVRGTHIVLREQVSGVGVLLQSVEDRRVFFVLPWKGTTLVGTTEVLQSDPDETAPTDEEIEYLITRFNHYFGTKISHANVANAFAGARPLVGRASNPSAIGREYRVIRRGNLINVFGGKMTTFMALARRVSMRVDNYFGRSRSARPPVFAIQN
ncbi:MAG TPA: FAD-dependent oxidoreductase [Thermoanaerobaculia bacterium]|nr:FAD-dependent oxidoreductase [Thermoanaerobaculia bacterium]